jgi:Gram-negative bacterial TonB protein C-terminal
MASVTYLSGGGPAVGASTWTGSRLCATAFAVALALGMVSAMPAQDATQQPAAPSSEASSQAGSQSAPQAAPAAETTAPVQVQPSPTTEPQQLQPAAQPATATPAAPKQASAEDSRAGAITEDELRHLLVGKSLYLRGGYLDNSLEFDEHGQLISHSQKGSYTLSGIEIDKVRLSKHKVELDGARYGLHFLGALPYEDPTKAVDRVKITPKKKFVKITIDRELVVTPKKKKQKSEKIAEKNAQTNSKIGPGGLVMPAQPDTKPIAEPQAEPATEASSQSAGQPASQAENGAAQTSDKDQADEGRTDEDQAKAEMAAAPPEERPAAPGSVTTTTSPAHAAKVLKDALDQIFADGLDDRMMAAMPDFWKLYYQAAAQKTDFKPADPAVLRQGDVDQKAKLLTTFQPESNDFAQDAGVAGMCLYHAVIGADGKPEQIAVARPIGFGLDESAVAAISKASFQPAVKDGHPVPVVLDLVVQFHIYSKRTNVAGNTAVPDKGPILPGPYSLNRQQQTAQSQ